VPSRYRIKKSDEIYIKKTYARSELKRAAQTIIKAEQCDYLLVIGGLQIEEAMQHSLKRQGYPHSRKVEDLTTYTAADFVMAVMEPENNEILFNSICYVLGNVCKRTGVERFNYRNVIEVSLVDIKRALSVIASPLSPK
jgi:hypothetical protein